MRKSTLLGMMYLLVIACNIILGAAIGFVVIHFLAKVW